MSRLAGGKLHFLQVSRAKVLNAPTVSTYQKLNLINTLLNLNTKYRRNPARGYGWKDTHKLPAVHLFYAPCGQKLHQYRNSLI
jgi:hypothetical protein